MMKREQVSECIWSVSIWAGVPLRVWLVKEDGGVTLVDAGLSMMARGIWRAVEELDVGELRRIVLTHGHPDHVGSIGRILEKKEIPVYAHAVEIPYTQGDIAYPLRRKPKAFTPKGVLKALEEDENGRLLPIGSLIPYFTPGHSPGHVAYYHEQDRVLLSGDLFSSKKGKLRRPLFTSASDMPQAVRSSLIVRELQPERVEICHGGPVFHAAEQIESYVSAQK